MKPVYQSNLFMLLIILGQIFGSLFLGRFLQQIFPYTQLLVVTQILFLLMPVMIYLLVTRQSIKETLKFNKISSTDILMVVAIALLCQPVASFLSAFSSMFFKNTVNEVFKEISSISYLTQIGIIALTPAICEEVTMRGIVLSGYDKVSRKKATLMTGLLFGILHLNLQQFLYAFVLGILFAYLVRITNSIFTSMICHFVFNGIQVTMAYIVAKVKPNMLNQPANLNALSSSEKLATLLPLFMTAIVFSVAVIWLVKRLDLKYKENARVQYIGYSNSIEENNEDRYSFGNNNLLSKERVVNGPFILIVITYTILMIFTEIMG